MFRKYGFIGIAIVALAQVNFFFRIEPFATWYFPIIWLGYILVVDAAVYKLKGRSLLVNKPDEMSMLFILSIPFWYVFEFFNLFVLNWLYNAEFNYIVRFVSAAFLLPAMYETYLFIKSLRLFEKAKLPYSYEIKKEYIYAMIFAGFVCSLLPIFFPKYTFPLIWLCFFLVLDPVNYLHKNPSIIGHLKDRNLKTPLSLMLAGIVMGFFWEFWNYWAVPKWFYDLPFLDFFRVFEMPILGYLGYFPFAFEFYSMYWFVRTLFRHKKHMLSE